MDEILSIAQSKGTEDDIYDVKASIESVLAYMKHQMHDYQQRKAKAFCFDNLDKNKVLPVRYREKQNDYFGKKGMSLHIDVFFRKHNDDLLNMCT